MALRRAPYGRLPFFRAWCHRDICRGYGWLFGFWLAPWPREEHYEGDMARALCMVDGFASLSRRDFRVWLWCADPADRPISLLSAKP